MEGVRIMDTRRFVVLAVCVAVYLAIGGTAMATTIPSGQVEYWPGHYLQYEPVETGFDVFGQNYQARTAVGSLLNIAFLPWMGLPPYEGDDDAYYQRLADEDPWGAWGGDVGCAETCVNSILPWSARDWQALLQWNEAYLSNKDGDDTGPYLDWQPFLEGDHDSAPWDWQGSGAAVSMDWSGPTEDSWYGGTGEPCTARLMYTWVAVPDNATYVEYEWAPGCFCRDWFDAEGNEIGPTSDVAPSGDRLQWALVKQQCICDLYGLVMSYDSPSVPPGLGAYDGD
jgi:hypothetical protein